MTCTLPLSAQNDSRRSPGASFTIGASLGDGQTALASTAGFDVRFSERLGVELELAHARKLDFTLQLCPPPRVCVLGGQLPVTGRTVSLIPHLTFELLPRSTRLRAYADGGVGAGHVRQRYFFGPPFTASGDRVEFTRSSLTWAFSLGGGVLVPISPRLALGADVRSLHLRDDFPTLDRFILPAGTLSTLRIGVRISWRF